MLYGYICHQVPVGITILIQPVNHIKRHLIQCNFSFKSSYYNTVLFRSHLSSPQPRISFRYNSNINSLFCIQSSLFVWPSYYEKLPIWKIRNATRITIKFFCMLSKLFPTLIIKIESLIPTRSYKMRILIFFLYRIPS